MASTHFQSEETLMLQAALAYARRGWRVFPCHTPTRTGEHPACSCGKLDCADVGKHPRWQHTTLEHGLKDATADPERIRAWWNTWPEANIGIATGGPSGAVVLDVDPRHGGHLTLEELTAQSGQLPETPESLTGGGGRHLFFQHPGGYVKGDNTGNTLGAGLDIKADGGYIIAPPSLHKSGQRYEWELSSHPDELPLASLPAWLLERLTAKAQPPVAPSPHRDDLIPEGQRNATLASLAGTMRRRGMTAEEIGAALAAVNRDRCRPPLAEDEVRRIAASVSRYAPDAPSAEARGTAGPLAGEPCTWHLSHVLTHVSAVDKLVEMHQASALTVPKLYQNADACRHLPKAQVYAIGATLKAFFGRTFAVDKFVEAIYDADHEDQITPHAVAAAILKAQAFAIDAGRKLYRYADGVYHHDGALLVKRFVKRTLETWGQPDRWEAKLGNEVVEYISIDAPTLWERPAVDVINLRNGLFDVNTGELRAHSPEHLSPIQIPVEYHPQATCPQIDQFVAQVFPEDARELAYEIAAWLLVPDTSIQKAILLVGEGGNGKSTYLNLLVHLIGKPNTTAISLHKLEQDRFEAARLMGKLANICPDLPSTHLTNTSVFKALTGGDPQLAAERKFVEGFEFEPFVRLIFSANHYPRSGDNSPGFFDRWLVIPFGRAFRGTQAEIPRPVLDAMLTDPKELSGLLNQALARLPRVLGRGFTPSASVQAACNDFRGTTDPLAIWLDQHTMTDPGAIVAKDELCQAYNRTRGNGDVVMTATAFTQALCRLRPHVREVRRTVGGVPMVRCWQGIGLKTAMGKAG